MPKFICIRKCWIGRTMHRIGDVVVADEKPNHHFRAEGEKAEAKKKKDKPAPRAPAKPAGEPSVKDEL